MANTSVYETYLFQPEIIFHEQYLERAWKWHRDSDGWLVSVYVGAIYVFVVFALKKYMQNRPKFDLRRPLAIWSAGLAIFSIMGMLRCVPELLFVLRNHGFQATVCSPTGNTPASAMWQFNMVVSKFVELGDTIFILLRKQPLIFLHWYHHVTVMIYSSYNYTEFAGPRRWYCSLNYTVHGAMYSYYFLRACRISVPRFVNLFITTGQIAQMVMGLTSSLAVLYYKSLGHTCPMSNSIVAAASLMYFSYFVLFTQFFYDTYVKPRPKKVD